MRAGKLFAIALVFLLVVAIGIGLRTSKSGESSVVRTPTGLVVKLECYEFRPGTVRYDLPNRPLARIVEKVLPKAAQKRMPWMAPKLMCFVSSPFRMKGFSASRFPPSQTSFNCCG
jgi:hypothetical protein